jgi:hypothetical protein
MGHKARQAWLKWFSPPKQFNYVIDSCVDIMRTAKISERHVRRMWPLLLGSRRDRLFLDGIHGEVGHRLRRTLCTGTT